MNFLDQLLEKLSEGQKPNKFTIGMGELIRRSREEAKLSQRELANLIYRRQAALSEMENGYMEPDAETLLMLSHNLRKPITYFFPEPYKPDPNSDNLSENEIELILQARRLTVEDQKRIIAQARALADLDEKNSETNLQERGYENKKL